MLVLAALLHPAAAPAQDRPAPGSAIPVEPGARVRLAGPGTTRQVGTVVAATPDTLFVRWSPDDPTAMALAWSTPLEVSRGRRGRARRGAGIGALTGIVTGAVLGAVTHEPCPPDALVCFRPESAAETAIGAAALLGIAGGLAGGLVGAVWRTDVWHPVAPPRVWEDDDVPPPGRHGRIGLALRF